MSPTLEGDPSISKIICPSTTPHKCQVAMAPVSSGDRVLVVSSPYKGHTHSWASIQLGQHKLKPFATTRIWAKTLRPLLSNVVLQPCSFDSHCAGWVARSIKKINHPFVHAGHEITRHSFRRTACENFVDHLFTSSVNPAPNNTFRSIGSGTVRHVTTRVSQRQQGSTLKDQEKCWWCPVTRCVVVRT